MASVTKIGDWRIARQLLRIGPAKLNLAIDKAVLQEAHFFRKKIVSGITHQNPGGKKFKKLSPNTTQTRKAAGFKGRKALIRTGELRNSIVVVSKGSSAFVGIPRTARSKDGRSLVSLGELHEFGSKPIVIRMTRAMQAFLAIYLKGGGGGGNASGTGVVIVQIPARPFFRPVMKKHGKPTTTAARMRKRLVILLEGKFGV